jgi:hypothetical protein
LFGCFLPIQVRENAVEKRNPLREGRMRAAVDEAVKLEAVQAQTVVP